jgi:hypothetical protein
MCFLLVVEGRPAKRQQRPGTAEFAVRATAFYFISGVSRCPLYASRLEQSLPAPLLNCLPAPASTNGPSNMATLPVTTADQADVQVSRFGMVKEFAARLKENATATFSEVGAPASLSV